jgi:hypothetical protein
VGRKIWVGVALVVSDIKGVAGRNRYEEKMFFLPHPLSPPLQTGDIMNSVN